MVVSRDHDHGIRDSIVLTNFGKMVWLSVAHTRRPPRRLRLIWTQLLRATGNDLPTIVWVIDLLARFHELHIGFGNDSTVGLLKILKDLLIVSAKDVFVLD